MGNYAQNFKEKFYNSIVVQSLHTGFELSIPFLIIGAFALLFNNFPIAAYQDYIRTAFDGTISNIFVIIYTYTLGSVSLILCLTISSSYANISGNSDNFLYAATALASYMAFCSNSISNNIYIFGAQWLFTTMCITLLSCFFLNQMNKRVKFMDRFYTPGASYLFNIAVKNMLPVAVIVGFFSITGNTLHLLFGQENITNFGSELFLGLFNSIDSGLFKTLLYVLCIQVFWFFGIHGTNVLDSVAKEIFDPVINMNEVMTIAGEAPIDMYSSTFLNSFVFIGGCGSTLCMAIALLLFAKRKQGRKMAYYTLPLSLFNINEILLFGFPIVFNPTMLIPFIITPLVQVCISTVAMQTGLVPFVSHFVEWTVPPIFSGYLTTGSIAGSLLQIFNIFVGVFIYTPFVRMNEKKQKDNFQFAVQQMEKDIAYGEQHGTLPELLGVSYSHYSYAKTLVLDLKDALNHEEITLYYQPQILDGTKLYGVEALLRWKHPIAGFISPPLIIELATESGTLADLTYYLMKIACRDSREIQSYNNDHFHLSINISSSHIEQEDFCEKVMEIFKDFPRKNVQPVLELTERSLMKSTEHNYQKIETLRSAGIQFSIDDFGMGHNSVTLLQEDLFDEIKLDGSLVSQIAINERSREIVSKIVKLSNGLHYRVVAEFVETLNQKEILKTMDCDIYQGYYYSRPLPLPELLAYIQKLQDTVS